MASINNNTNPNITTISAGIAGLNISSADSSRSAYVPNFQDISSLSASSACSSPAASSPSVGAASPSKCFAPLSPDGLSFSINIRDIRNVSASSSAALYSASSSGVAPLSDAPSSSRPLSSAISPSPASFTPLPEASSVNAPLFFKIANHSLNLHPVAAIPAALALPAAAIAPSSSSVLHASASFRPVVPAVADVFQHPAGTFFNVVLVADDERIPRRMIAKQFDNANIADSVTKLFYIIVTNGNDLVAACKGKPITIDKTNVPGIDGSNYFNKCKIKAIFSDQEMGATTGSESILQIRTLGIKILAICQTATYDPRTDAANSQQVYETLKKAGFDDVVPKNPNWPDLLNRFRLLMS